MAGRRQAPSAAKRPAPLSVLDPAPAEEGASAASPRPRRSRPPGGPPIAASAGWGWPGTTDTVPSAARPLPSCRHAAHAAAEQFTPLPALHPDRGPDTDDLDIPPRAAPRRRSGHRRRVPRRPSRAASAADIERRGRRPAAGAGPALAFTLHIRPGNAPEAPGRCRDRSRTSRSTPFDDPTAGCTRPRRPSGGPTSGRPLSVRFPGCELYPIPRNPCLRVFPAMSAGLPHSRPGRPRRPRPEPTVAAMGFPARTAPETEAPPDPGEPGNSAQFARTS